MYILYCVCAVISHFSHVWLYATLWTVGPSVYGILQARILEWVAVSSCRGSSWPRDQTHISCVPCIAGGFLTAEPPLKPIYNITCCLTLAFLGKWLQAVMMCHSSECYVAEFAKERIVCVWGGGVRWRWERGL